MILMWQDIVVQELGYVILWGKKEQEQWLLEAMKVTQKWVFKLGSSFILGWTLGLLVLGLHSSTGEGQFMPKGREYIRYIRYNNFVGILGVMLEMAPTNHKYWLVSFKRFVKVGSSFSTCLHRAMLGIIFFTTCWGGKLWLVQNRIYMDPLLTPFLWG